MIFDVNIDFTRKEHYGHQTEPPGSYTYVVVVLRVNVCIAFLLGALKDVNFLRVNL